MPEGGNPERAFSTAGFEPLPPPGPRDWLANHPERGQTFEAFLAARPNRPDATRNRIYFQPLEQFPAGAPSIPMLGLFAHSFFSLAVSMLPPLSNISRTVTTRKNPYTRQRQLLTTDILSLLRRSVPKDAFSVVAITMEDLYPEESWNFVFGQASLRDRVGVFSFARYTAEASANLLLRRSCKVLAHETAHMFGIEHCIFFKCLMNGSNHLAESDRRPLHLCPIDLRKLHHSVGFDITKRYQALEAFAREVRFDDEAEWLHQRIRLLRQ